MEEKSSGMAFNYLESLSGIETSRGAAESLISGAFNYLESLSGIETRAVISLRLLSLLLITLNPYQGLKPLSPRPGEPFSGFLTFNYLESLSGIET